jgi:surfeit locus 1 family protein
MALGVWQLERRTWKLDLIAKLDARIHAAPVPLTEIGAVRMPADAYRRVTATGRFLHARETLVQAVTERGAGFWVLTPLQTTAGLVLVNRGFVSPERAASSSRQAGLNLGSVEIVGLLRATEPRGGFLRRNDPAADRWFSRDVAAIAQARSLGAVLPFFIDADATPNPGGWPIGGLTVVRFRNTHLIYALTWFGLALLSGAGAWLVLRTRRSD